MGDYTPGQVVIYSINREDVRAALEILEEHSLAVDFGFEVSPIKSLALCETYGNSQVRGDESEEIATQLQERCPSASFETWTDPAYEWLGSYTAFTPELGAFVADCDASGQPQFSHNHLEGLLRKQPGDLTVEMFLTQVLPRATGHAWQVALAAKRQRNAGVVLEPEEESDEPA